MNANQQRDYLLAQLADTRRLLAETPEDYYGERLQFGERIADLERELRLVTTEVERRREVATTVDPPKQGELYTFGKHPSEPWRVLSVDHRNASAILMHEGTKREWSVGLKDFHDYFQRHPSPPVE